MLRGAPDHVLRCLSAAADEDNTAAMSILDIAVTSGYSLTAVEYSVKQLERHGYIRIEHGGPRRPNRYTILPPVPQRQRVAREMARAVGLVE